MSLSRHRSKGPWQAAAGKTLMNVIERRKCTVLSRLDVSLFVEGGGGGETRGNFPKQRLVDVCLARSPIYDGKKALRFVSCSLNEIHHHKNSMTDLTRPGSLPCEELQSHPSSKRQEASKKRSLSCRGRAAKFPSCGIIS